MSKHELALVVQLQAKLAAQREVSRELSLELARLHRERAVEKIRLDQVRASVRRLLEYFKTAKRSDSLQPVWRTLLEFVESAE